MRTGRILAVAVPVTLLVTGCGLRARPPAPPAPVPTVRQVALPRPTHHAAAKHRPRPVPPPRVAAPVAPPAAPAPVCTAPGGPSAPTEAGTAVVGRVPVYASPGGARTTELSNPTSDGAPLAFRVLRSVPGWLDVQLPIRPNGAAGWIPERDAGTYFVSYRLDVYLSAHCLLVWGAHGLLGTLPVADGAPGTPTPTGTFFLAALWQSPNPYGAYGPYAYGLSAYSDVLQDFGGGPGEIGLHGTDEPWSIGYSASHGCIRVTDDAIRWLVRTVPVGTPIDIHP